MSRIIKEFKVPDFDKYNFRDVGVGSPVFFSHKYGLEDICGKVVYISERRKIINIEFTKLHPIHKILKGIELNLKLDLVHVETMDFYHPKLVTDFVIYTGHGSD